MAQTILSRELKRDLASEHDFVVRRRSNLWLQMVFLLVVAFGILFLTANNLGSGDIPWLHLFVLIVVLGTLGFIGYIQVQRHRDLLLLTEFQNALFTSTARLNFRFCLIAKREGSIVYYDPGFQNLFPHLLNQANASLDHLFDRRQMPEDLTREINRLLQEEESGVMLMPFITESGEATRLVLHVDPLHKPKGYVAIRGREYIENRSLSFEGDMPAPVMGNAAMPNQLLNHILDHANDAAYAADGQGKLIYANAALHQMLGYGEGQILAEGLTLDRLVYQRAGSGALGGEAYEGEAIFHQRNGNMVKYHVRQRAWHNAEGLALGTYGYLSSLADAAKRTL